MASRTRGLQIQQQEAQRRQNAFKKACDKTRFYHFAGIVVCLITFLLFYVTFVEVYNTSYGVEVKVNGWGFFTAGLTGGYSLPDKVYGDLAMPFYYYAKTYCESIGTMMAIVFFINIALIVLDFVVIFTRKHFLSFCSFVLGVVSAVLLLIVFITALSMKNSDILPVYCSGNPACSIKSRAIIPCLGMIVYAVCTGYIAVKLLCAYKGLKQKG